MNVVPKISLARSEVDSSGAGHTRRICPGSREIEEHWLALKRGGLHMERTAGTGARCRPTPRGASEAAKLFHVGVDGCMSLAFSPAAENNGCQSGAEAGAAVG